MVFGVSFTADAVSGPDATIGQGIGSPRGDPIGTVEDPVDQHEAHAEVLWVPEPGACGGRIDPEQDLVPGWLADQLDWHLRPSASPWATARMARTSCAHVDWTMVWMTDPLLFLRRAQLGVPAPPDLWHARTVLADLGYELVLEVQLENLRGELGLAVYGAGVAGSLTAQAWQAVAPLLTTCSATIREPVNEPSHDPLVPDWPVTAGGAQLPATRVAPLGWWIGNWHHTWWSYPMAGPLRLGCPCPAHWVTPEFGPVGHDPAVSG